MLSYLIVDANNEVTELISVIKILYSF